MLLQFVLQRFHKKGWTEKVNQFIIGDIRDQSTIDSISNVRADVLIHLISLDHHDLKKT